jgi:hypothetical protein
MTYGWIFGGGNTPSKEEGCMANKITVVERDCLPKRK